MGPAFILFCMFSIISNTESVRDVQFSPHSHLTFASVSENGNVQIWDMRKPDKCVLQFTAHSGPIFACDWHPETACLATASRDKTIKVINFTCFIIFTGSVYTSLRIHIADRVNLSHS